MERSELVAPESNAVNEPRVDITFFRRDEYPEFIVRLTTDGYIEAPYDVSAIIWSYAGNCWIHYHAKRFRDGVDAFAEIEAWWKGLANKTTRDTCLHLTNNIWLNLHSTQAYGRIMRGIAAPPHVPTPPTNSSI